MAAHDAGAFVPNGRFTIAGAGDGRLAGLTFAVKDLYDVAGHPTGAGNPSWLDTHPIPAQHAPIVQTLLDAGATLIGKTITDELAYSINGDNIHYGTPENVNAPGRVPGGSSSGSAAAVAAGLCDFAMGTDTGGSVRIPASFCGVWGIRPTHGALPAKGIVPLMPSFDTFGWLAQNASILARVGDVLLPPNPVTFKRLLILEDALAESEPAAANVLAGIVDALRHQFAMVEQISLSDTSLEDWRKTYVDASAPEGWQVHGEWIETTRPTFGPAIAQRFAYAKSVTPDVARAAQRERERIAQYVRHMLGPDTVAILPTAAGPAPRLDASAAEVDGFRTRTMRLTCIAGLAGLPQVNIPRRLESGLPLGMSLLGPAGSDRALMTLAAAVAR
jgi:amidase